MIRFLTALFILLGLFAKGQTYYNDAQVRTHLNLEKKINKHFMLNLGQQNRFTNNISTLSRMSWDLGLTYKINKNIRFTADYVFIQKLSKYGYYNNRHWYSLALNLKKEVKRFTFLYRNMFQARQILPGQKNEGQSRYYDRNKFTVKYELTKRYSSYIAEELYVPLNSPRTKGIDRSRTYLGLEIITFKGQELELYFMFQAQTQYNQWFKQPNNYPDAMLKHYYVYGVKYNISF